MDLVYARRSTEVRSPRARGSMKTCRGPVWGLAIVRDLVSLYSGSIALGSSSLGGTGGRVDPAASSRTGAEPRRCSSRSSTLIERPTSAGRNRMAGNRRLRSVQKPRSTTCDATSETSWRRSHSTIGSTLTQREEWAYLSFNLEEICSICFDPFARSATAATSPRGQAQRRRRLRCAPERHPRLRSLAGIHNYRGRTPSRGSPLFRSLGEAGDLFLRDFPCFHCGSHPIVHAPPLTQRSSHENRSVPVITIVLGIRKGMGEAGWRSRTSPRSLSRVNGRAASCWYPGCTVYRTRLPPGG